MKNEFNNMLLEQKNKLQRILIRLKTVTIISF